MSFTNAPAILAKVKAILIGPITALVPTISVSTDEPVNFVFSDLPLLNIYPVKEDFIFDESTNNEDKKHLSLRVELRMACSSASAVCTPMMDAICIALKANRRLDGLAVYTELQGLQWANESTSSGSVGGMSLDIEVQYFVS